jgi:hypothetical protein
MWLTDRLLQESKSLFLHCQAGIAGKKELGKAAHLEVTFTNE